MWLFSRRAKRSEHVTVQRPHDANPRHHRRAARGHREQDQGLDRSLPQATYYPGEQPETV
jgi:hypothetical protein